MPPPQKKKTKITLPVPVRGFLQEAWPSCSLLASPSHSATAFMEFGLQSRPGCWTQQILNDPRVLLGKHEHAHVQPYGARQRTGTIALEIMLIYSFFMCLDSSLDLAFPCGSDLTRSGCVCVCVMCKTCLGVDCAL